MASFYQQIKGADNFHLFKKNGEKKKRKEKQIKTKHINSAIFLYGSVDLK